MDKILVVDDEKEICDHLVEQMTEEGFLVQALQNPSKIRETIDEFQPDVLLLDYRMPGQSGAQVVKDLKADAKYRHLAMIIVTGLDEEEEKIEALELGADDYVLKPFSPKELSARIRAVLRRVGAGRKEEKGSVLEKTPLKMNLNTYKVFLGEQPVQLTLTEFKILEQLLKSDGHVLSREKLRETALGNLNVSDRTIDVHMAALRKKLGSVAEAIETVRGVGYRFP